MVVDVQLQRAAALKNDLPRVIRPDLLVTDHGLALTELDSVPGGKVRFGQWPGSREDRPPLRQPQRGGVGA